MLILPPGHYQEVHSPRRRGTRERWVLGLCGLLAAVVAAVTIYSLTSHAQKSANGCLNFTYSMVMGAENVHECGAPARELCASPQRAAHAEGNIAGLEDDLIKQLPRNCREAGLPYKTTA